MMKKSGVQIAQNQRKKKHEVTDEELMATLAIGGLPANKAAAELHKRYGKLVQRSAEAYFWSGARHKDGGIAEDVCQEVWIKVCRKAGTFKADKHKKDALARWLRTVTRLTCIDFDRKNKRDPGVAPPEKPKVKIPGLVESASEDDSDQGQQALDPATHEDKDADSPDGVAHTNQVMKRYKERSPECYRLIRAIATDNLEPKSYKDFLKKSAGAAREFASQCKKLLMQMLHDDGREGAMA